MLDWFPNADHVGIYQALAEGDFTQAGPRRARRDPRRPRLARSQLLAAGKVDAAISYEPEVMLARNQGQPLVSVGGDRAGAADLDRVDRLQAHQDAGPSCAVSASATPGSPTSTPTWTTILARAGVPLSSVKEINVGANLVPAMLSGRVDATLGAVLELRGDPAGQLHKHPNVIHMDQRGRSDLQRAGRSRDARTRSSTTRTSSAGSSKRSRAATNPSGGTRRRPSRTWSRPARASTRSSSWPVSRPPSRTYFPSNSRLPWGWQDPTQWNAYGEWMLKQPPDLRSERGPRRVDQRASGGPRHLRGRL